jgi:hypothetical protein
MTSMHQFEFGDRVRHQKRPEWGVGSVVKAEQVTVEGQPTQRLSIRFPNAGIKTLSTLHAELERLEGEVTEPITENGQGGIADLDRLGEEGWLGPVVKRKIEEVMTTLPEQARDPFRGLRARLEFTLQLYRFDRSGRGLVDWAVAQSGLEDPLSRFTRQELEQKFDRWAFERDNHLRRLLAEARSEAPTVDAVMRSAPPAARAAVQRISAQR